MAVVTGDEAFVRAVYNDHGRAMLTYATRLLNDRTLAEDVVQDALIRVWRNPEALTNGKGSPRGYVLTTVRNLVIDRHRAVTARPPEAAMPDLADSSPAGAVVPDFADALVEREHVIAALDRLSEDHRAVVKALYFGDQKVDEIAVELGVPPGTVKSRSHYALRALRAALFGPPDTEPPRRRASARRPTPSESSSARSAADASVDPAAATRGQGSAGDEPMSDARVSSDLQAGGSE